MSNSESRAASESSRRRWQNGFILLFLALQIGVPLRYYLRRGDYDERFSWRMFSTLRLRDCSVHVTELGRGARANPQEVTIERDVHVAWLRLLERERTAVVDKYLQRRCESSEIERATYVRTCRDTDGSELPATERSLDCERGQFVDEGAP